MKPIRILLFLTTIFLQACATTAAYEEALDTWLGSDINSLVQQLGPPDSTFEAPNGDIMYTYNLNSGTVAMPAGNTAYAVDVSCKTTFTAGADGTIKGWRYEGNNCVAY